MHKTSVISFFVEVSVQSQSLSMCVQGTYFAYDSTIFLL